MSLANKLLLVLIAAALTCWTGGAGVAGRSEPAARSGAGIVPNQDGKWALHFAGPHDSKANTCDFSIAACESVAVDAPGGPGRYDVYVLAVDVEDVSATRFGLACDGPFVFYGWTSCALLEIPTPGWPGPGEGNALTWSSSQAGPVVTMGILDCYVYGGTNSLSTGPDPRVGFAQWCDGTDPSPVCYATADSSAFSTLGFGAPGAIDCDAVGTPSCEVSPTSLDFGSVDLGSSSELTFTITNTGTWILFGAASELCDGYSIVGGGEAYVLAPGESHEVTVRFSPTHMGSYNCTVDPGEDLCSNVTCVGEGALQRCNVAPTNIDFGIVNLGSSSDRVFTITNAGTGVLSGQVSASHACNCYTLISGGGPYSLGPGESREVTVRFSPTSVATYNCTIETGLELCEDVACTGRGGIPGCAVSPTSLDFGEVNIGLGANMSFTISSTGSGVLSGTVSETCDHYVIASGGGSYTLGPGESREVTVRFSPTAEGTHTCTIETGDELCSDVGCSGVGAIPTCEVSPTSLDFGAIDVGSTLDRVFTITNIGSETLSGAVSESCGQYGIVGGGGSYTLGPGESREVTVRFAPASSGTHSCTIETGDDMCSDVSCTGEGLGPRPNEGGKWALHYAGPHDSKANTCGFSIGSCESVVVDAPAGPGRYDVYLLGVDVDEVTATRFGLACDGPFFFYGWTRCSDLELPTTGWPGCDEGNAVAWGVPQPGPTVTLGILDLYVYGSSNSLSTGPDPRVGLAEWCDGSDPNPYCYSTADLIAFSTMGFGIPGRINCEEGSAFGCEISPSALSFGSVEVDSSSDQSFTITNTGEELLSGSVSESCDQYAVVLGSGPYSLAPGEYHEVTVRFSPTSPGAHDCWIDTGTGSCSDVHCTGEGTPKGTGCEVSPTTLGFGTVGVGTAFSRTFTIENTSTEVLSGTVSESCGHYSIISGGGAYTLQPGEQRTVEVRFSPTSSGTHECTIETGDELCSDVFCTGDGYSGYIPNRHGKWALHYAGPHDEKVNTCDFQLMDCMDVDVSGPSAAGRYDVYVIAIEVTGITATRYGLTCDGPFFFYGWTYCSDLELPTSGWPGCGEGNAQTWDTEQAGPNVTIGILDLYVYGGSEKLAAGSDPRVGFAEWCDGSEPNPLCYKTSDPSKFGWIGFNGVPGYNPCGGMPVALAGFSAKATDEGILLEWRPSDPGEFSHFFVHRSAGSRDGQYVRLNETALDGGGFGGAEYTYLDEGVIPGTLYYYKLEGVRRDGESAFFGPYEAMASATRSHYALYQNVPNPFSRGSTTTISYSVAEGGQVKIMILDAAGRHVRTLEDTARPGPNSLVWDGTDERGRAVVSGVYFYEIRAGAFRAQRKMLIVD